MANILLPLIIIFIFIFINCLIHSTMADTRMDLLYKKCGKGHVQNVSKYNENYTKLLRTMQEEMQKNKFAKGQEGDGPNRVYVMSQCMNDLSRKECGVCFSKINTLLSGCFPSPRVLVFFDGCFMRVANYNFFHESDSPDEDVQRCSETPNGAEQFSETATAVVKDLIEKGPNNNGYAVERATSYGFSVYGMSNCWKTLNTSSCASCLAIASEMALGCLPSVEGRALSVGCFLHYSDYEFIGKHSSLSSEDAIFLYLFYVLGAVGICLLAILVGYFAGKAIYNTRLNCHNEPEGLVIDSSVMKRSFHFKYCMLAKATDNFSEAHKIGQGGFGEVFKGTLPDGREMAIKRLFISGKLRIKEVCNEVDIIDGAQHKNLVRYLGGCFTHEDSLLVYEYLPNKSLDLILFDPEKKKELEWKKRLGIILATAEGLEYLHNNCKVRIIHRDIKASNILLDSKYRPKISDFGLARFYSNDQIGTDPAIAGTLGYMAPEYLAQGRLTEKVDVYSYGVLVLEIVSGMQNNTFQPESSLNTLVTSTWKHFQENSESEIIDRSMEIEESIDEILRVIQIGLLCTQESPTLRPSMTSVIQMLTHKNLELPTPSKPPFTIESFNSSNSLGSSLRQRSISIDSCKYYNNDNSQR